MSNDRKRRLAEIRKRCEAATDGPWEHWENSAGCGVSFSGVNHFNGAHPKSRHYEQSNADAAFIAHAREDVPFLLAEIEAENRAANDEAACEAILAERDRLRGEVRRFEQDHLPRLQALNDGLVEISRLLGNTSAIGSVSATLESVRGLVEKQSVTREQREKYARGKADAHARINTLTAELDQLRTELAEITKQWQDADAHAEKMQAERDKAKADLAAMTKRAEDAERMFPIQGNHYGAPGGYIPWWLAEIAWLSYAAHGHGSQSLERLAERKGFSWLELGHLLAGTYRDTPPTTPPDQRAREALIKAWENREGGGKS